MVGMPNFGQTAHQAAYEQLVRGLLSDDDRVIADCVDAARFTAVLPRHEPLKLEEFRKYMRNLLSISPDFGLNVTIINAAEGPSVLAVLYNIVYTVDGKRVDHECTDWVTYNPQGEVIELRVQFDVGAIQQEVFGKSLPRP